MLQLSYLDEFKSEAERAVGRNIIHFLCAITPLSRYVYFILVPLIHTHKSNLPSHYQVADTEKCRQRLPFCRVELRPVNQATGVVDIHNTCRLGMDVSSPRFKLLK